MDAAAADRPTEEGERGGGAGKYDVSVRWRRGSSKIVKTRSYLWGEKVLMWAGLQTTTGSERAMWMLPECLERGLI